MGNEIYTDLENAVAREKRESIRMKIIELLVDEFHNDEELGKAVRDYVNIEKKDKND